MCSHVLRNFSLHIFRVFIRYGNKCMIRHDGVSMGRPSVM